jgi:hypothetical protein
MFPRRDCQKVLLRRPFTGLALWLAGAVDTRNRDSERWAAARDPPSEAVSRAVSRYADMTLGGHAGPPRSQNQDPSDRSQERNSSWQVTTLHRVPICARGQCPRSPA